MRRPLLGLLPLLAALLAPPAPATEVKRVQRELELGDQGRIRVEAAAATVYAEPYNGERVSAALAVSCGGELYGCRELGERVRLAAEPAGGALDVRLVGPLNVVEPGRLLGPVVAGSIQSCSAARGRRRGRGERPEHRLSADLSLRYPADRELAVSLTRGLLVVNDPRGSLELEVGEGSITIHLRRESAGAVHLRSSGGGKTCVIDPNGRVLDSGRRVDWQPGSGPIEIRATVGRGDVAVRLAP